MPISGGPIVAPTRPKPYWPGAGRRGEQLCASSIHAFFLKCKVEESFLKLDKYRTGLVSPIQMHRVLVQVFFKKTAMTYELYWLACK